MGTIAEALQRSLLPERLPEVAGVASSARYVASPSPAQVGGDWYDLIALRDGLAGIAIGDVVGSGLQAAATMARLQNALRVYAVDGLRPSVALERMNGFARDAADRPAATALYSIIDPETGRMDLASAGHPPPLIIGPHGDAWFADGPTGTALGVACYPVYEETTISLEPGATVLLYTDGLIARPGVAFDEGLDRLRGLVSGSSGLDDLCSMLLRASFQEAPPADDVALLAVRLEPVKPEPMELTLEAEPESLAYMRRVVERWLRVAGADDAETYEILVACGEACANAVTHAYPAGDTSSYVVKARQRDGVVEIEVRDFGRWRTRMGSEGGGLRLISQLADELEVDRAATGTVVRMRRAVKASPPQAPQGHR